MKGRIEREDEREFVNHERADAAKSFINRATFNNELLEVLKESSHSKRDWWIREVERFIEEIKTGRRLP